MSRQSDSVDEVVEQTFPASDPPKKSPAIGPRADSQVLREAPTAPAALRGLLVAGLQALETFEKSASVSLPILADNAEDHELASWLLASAGHGEQWTLRLAQALASFGQAARTDITLPPGQAEFADSIRAEAAGPGRDLAIVLQTWLFERAKLDRYEAVSTIARAVDAADADRLLSGNIAEARPALDELGQILARIVSLIPSRPSLAVSTSLSLFGVLVG